MEKKQESPFTGQGSGAVQKRNNGNYHNSAEAQRQRLYLYLLKNGSITTCEARRELDILCPAARVMELRRRGLEIDLIWVDDLSEMSQPHRVGRYILTGEAVTNGQG